MPDPTLTISIDRTSLSLSPLVLSGADDGVALGIAGYAEPAYQARITYAGESPWLDGSTAVAASWQQSILGFDVVPTTATEETLRELIVELREAVSQFSYLITVTAAGADPVVWRCDMGSIGAVQRTYADLLDQNPVYPVTIPVYPIPVT